MKYASYNQIGQGYDSTRRADPRIAHEIATLLGEDVGRPVLDLGCGTGNYALALSAAGYSVVGLDRSEVMLREARGKSSDVTWVLGDATSLPFPANAFGGVLCCFSLHHFPDLDRATAEIHRVLATGRLVVFTSLPEQTGAFWLKHYFPSLIERSAAQMPSLDDMRTALRAAGFSAVEFQPWETPDDLEDHFLYAGKHRPALYLDPRIRAGISSFAALADDAENVQGLNRLSTDIESGEIDDVISAYPTPGGDYGYVTAER